MSTTLESLGIYRMSIEERMALVEEILDSIFEDQEKIPLTDAQEAELDRRIAAYEANPNIGIPWEQVIEEALAKYPVGK